MLTGPQFSTDRLAAVRDRIAAAARRAGRDPAAVRLVAVSKQQPSGMVRAAAAAGQRDFGENYLQEALPKMAELEPLGLDWHYIGQLQANKTRDVAQAFHWVHTVDRPRVAERLSGQRPPHVLLTGCSMPPRSNGLGVSPTRWPSPTNCSKRRPP